MTGEKAGGTGCWMVIQSTMCGILWLLTFCLVLIILACVVWYMFMWVINMLLATAAAAIPALSQASNNAANSLAQLNATVSNYAAAQALAASSNTTFNSGVAFNMSRAAAANLTTVSCPASCVNLAFLAPDSSNPCFCDTQKIFVAQDQSQKAVHGVYLVLVGSFFMWAGSSFMLMNAVADFARTKRERQLLTRAERNARSAQEDGFPPALSMEGGQGPGGAVGGGMLPLLKTRQHEEKHMQMQVCYMGGCSITACGKMHGGPGSAYVAS